MVKIKRETRKQEDQTSHNTVGMQRKSQEIGSNTKDSDLLMKT